MTLSNQHLIVMKHDIKHFSSKSLLTAKHKILERIYQFPYEKLLFSRNETGS